MSSVFRSVGMTICGDDTEPWAKVTLKALSAGLCATLKGEKTVSPESSRTNMVSSSGVLALIFVLSDKLNSLCFESPELSGVAIGASLSDSWTVLSACADGIDFRGENVVPACSSPPEEL